MALSPSARLDGGFHYEHHSHPDTDFGLLGFMDVLCATIPAVRLTRVPVNCRTLLLVFPKEM